jgi:RimJ/RimL family protein N-acetyltransferase
VLVRLWVDSDAEALFAAIDRSREHLKRWVDWVDLHHDSSDTQAYIGRALLGFRRRQLIPLGIFDGTDTQTVLGGTGFHDIDWTVPAVEIGYWVVTEAEGRGYATEAVALLTEFALREFRANRIAIYCDPKNVRSRNVAERLGYRFEGRLRNTGRTPQGTLRGSLAFSLLPGEWSGASVDLAARSARDPAAAG